MKGQVLHTVWCNISGEAAGEIWYWSLLGVKGLKGWENALFELGSERVETNIIFSQNSRSLAVITKAILKPCLRYWKTSRELSNQSRPPRCWTLAPSWPKPKATLTLAWGRISWPVSVARMQPIRTTMAGKLRRRNAPSQGREKQALFTSTNSLEVRQQP